MFDRMTRKTAFYAVGGGVGAGLLEAVTEFLSLIGRGGGGISSVLHVALWMGLIALGLSIGLLVAQNVYLRRTPSVAAVFKPVAVGFLSGAIAGGAAQFVFGMAQAFDLALSVKLAIQAFCWGLAGLGVGLGVSFFVPNYPAGRALLAGFVGGAAGGAAFVLINLFSVFPEGAARVAGVGILGLSIGLTLSAVEEMLRAAWLTVIWAKNETTSVALGEKPVILGSAPEATVRLPRSKFPPITAILAVRDNRVMMENRLNNQTVALPNGSKINIGKISIVIHIRKSRADRKENAA